MAMHMFKLLINLTMLGVVFATKKATLVKPMCQSQSQCGNINIPYPFGTSNGCYLNEDFHITCDTTLNPPKPFLTTGNSIEFSSSTEKIEVLKIYLQSHQLKISSPVAYDCYNGSSRDSFAYRLPKFFISSTKNKFTAVGCNTHAFIGRSQGNDSAMGCLSLCDNMSDVINGSCSGLGCCQTMIPNGVSGFDFTVSSHTNDYSVQDFSPCSYAFPVEDGAFKFSSSDLQDLRNIKEFPLVLDWAIGDQTCDNAMKDPKSYACKENSKCTNSENGPGYWCSCLNGYEGNPYLTNGCQDIDECQNKSLNNCSRLKLKCKNVPGNYYCYPSKGSKGKMLGKGIGIGAVGMLVLFVGAGGSYIVIKEISDNTRKQKFFKRNGGLLLQEKLSSSEVNAGKIKVFKSEEVEKATDNFNVDRMLGQRGTSVCKGMLTNGRNVAVKKSKVVDKGKIGQFINEVVNLSQIDHMNVVKMLGCCLETETPQLVYEFIPNETLFQYLHDQNEEFPLTWDVRLRIATEVAGALSCLHNAASLPICHRDIKSTNILLDDKYRAKVANFGISSAIDQTDVTTMVEDTSGYLDPECCQSRKFTEKSDVYSFGVVLVELLTGQEPISSTRTQEARSLATYFILSMEKNRLFDILDSQVMKEDRKEEVMVVANLAERCLNLNGKKRPTMKEVTMELERIHKSKKSVNHSENNEEVEYMRNEDSWVDASASTGSGLDSGTISSFLG